MARGLSLSRVAGTSASTASNNSSSGPSRVWTPLRENHFEPPLLSARERAYLVRKSCEAAQSLVERARSVSGPVAWRYVEKANGVQIYTGSLRSTASGTALSTATMCGVTSVPGTVTEVASLFQLGSTRQMKEFARAHREWFYDGIVLHTLAARTKEKPFHQVTAKWMVMQMPSGVAHRDFCYLECQDKFMDARGRKGWVLGQHSIKLPGCDDLKREFGLVRGSLYHSGFVVVESEERAGHVDVIHVVQLNLKDHTAMTPTLLQSRVMFVAQVRNMMRSKRLNEQRYLSDLELVPRKYRSRCAVCQDSFSLLLLRKFNCRKCGEVVCAACSKEFPIAHRSFSATNGGDEVRKLRICMHCFQVITNASKPTSALVEPPHSSAMSASFLGYHDDDQRAVRVGGALGVGTEDAPQIFLQSMRRPKPLQSQMSRTSPIPSFKMDYQPSNSRHRTREGLDGSLHQRSQSSERQSYEYGPYRDSQVLRSSEFQFSQSLSLDDPIARGEGCFTLRMPGAAVPTSPASIFDRPVNGRSPNEVPSPQSRDMSNFSRLQMLSSRERLEQLQRQDNLMSSSTNDQRMPDAYMSALEQASRDKLDFDMPSLMYQGPSSDFSAFSATMDDHSGMPSDFGQTLDDPNGPPPLDMSALTSAASRIPIGFDSMSMDAMLPTASKDGGSERKYYPLPDQYRESTSSSVASIDIDTYDDDLGPFVRIPPIVERLNQENGRSVEQELFNMPPAVVSIENRMNAVRIRDTDDDSDTSMGASDDEEERRANAMLVSAPHEQIDGATEETKVQDFSATLALPSFFSSGREARRSSPESPLPSKVLTDSQQETALASNAQGMKHMHKGDEEDLNVYEQHLQHSKAGNLIDYQIHLNEQPAMRVKGEVSRDFNDHGQGLLEGKDDKGLDEKSFDDLGCDLTFPDAHLRQSNYRDIGQSHDIGEQKFEGELPVDLSFPSARGSSICSMDLDSATPPVTSLPAVPSLKDTA